MTNTTGTTIATQSRGTEILIAVDRGRAKGTVAEYNVRMLDQVATLKHINISSEAFRAVTSSRAGYGMGLGDTGKLYPITDAEITTLRAANDLSKAEKAAYSEDDDRDYTPSPTCPLCGSYCYGDCTASEEM